MDWIDVNPLSPCKTEIHQIIRFFNLTPHDGATQGERENDTARFAPEEADTALLRPEDRRKRESCARKGTGRRMDSGVCTSAAGDIVIGYGSAYALATTVREPCNDRPSQLDVPSGVEAEDETESWP